MVIPTIALAALAACTDDADDRHGTGQGDHSLSFLVSTHDTDARTRADGSRTDASTRYLAPVELQGKLAGKSVYLQAEVSDGFPGDDQPLTRGTQIDKTNKDTEMQPFAVSVYTDKTGKPDYMYNMKVTKGDGTSYWKPEEKALWPAGKTLSFYAWHPYGADGLTVSGKDAEGAPMLTYIIPDEVADQKDFMTSTALDESESASTALTFHHALAAVKFSASADMPACTVKSIELKSVKYIGTYSFETAAWTPEDKTSSFSLTFDGGKELDGTGETAITTDGQTFLMMPQTFDDETARLEMTVEANGYTQTLGAPLKDIVADGWKAGKTYTIRITPSAFDVELVRSLFAATGKEAVVHVKSYTGWTAEVLANTENGQDDVMTFAPGQDGVADNSGSNDAAKLVFGTKKQSSLNGEKIEVTVRFTPKGLGKPVDKTVTFWKALEAPENSNDFYAVSSTPVVLTLPQITNREQCPDGYSLPTEEVAVTISKLTETDKEVAYDKTYPTLDLENSSADIELWASHTASNVSSNSYVFEGKELDHIKILGAGFLEYGYDNGHLHIKAKYPYCKNGLKEEIGTIDIGAMSSYLKSTEMTSGSGYLTLVAYMRKDADNLLVDTCFFDIQGFPGVTTGLENCMEVFDTKSYNGHSLAFLINTSESIGDRIYHAVNQGTFIDTSQDTGSLSPTGKFRRTDISDKSYVSFGMYADRYCCSDSDTRERLNGKNIISPTVTTYYVRKLAADE